MELKTPLYQTHLKYQGKIVPFAGYLLPVQYPTGVIQEHMAVRERCGLFDVSHMGEILLQGPDALENLNHLLCNDFSVMNEGQARYSPMLNEQGGIVDDLIVYKVKEGSYFIVVNASNRMKDFQWMQAHIFGDAVLKDISDEVAQLALQGPKAAAILEKLCDPALLPKKYYTCNFDGVVAGIKCIISRTGYTGESGFELYCGQQQAEALFEALMEAGKEEGLIPCGLGARDTLRLEAAMPLYGHEMTEEISPLEAKLGMFVKLNKDDFIGKAALLEKGEPTRKRVGLKVIGRGIIREEATLYVQEQVIGKTTSGTHAPYLGYPIAMALVDIAYAQEKTAVEAEVRGRRVMAEVVALPFYKKSK